MELNEAHGQTANWLKESSFCLRRRKKKNQSPWCLTLTTYFCRRCILTGTKLCVRALPASSPKENRWLYNTFYYRWIQWPSYYFHAQTVHESTICWAPSHDCNRKILPGLCLCVKSKFPRLINCMRLIGGKVWLCSFFLLKEEAWVAREGNHSGPTIRVTGTCVGKLSLLSGV